MRLEWHGVPVAIECKLDNPGARGAVEAQAEERLETNLASNRLESTDFIDEALSRTYAALGEQGVGGEKGGAAS